MATLADQNYEEFVDLVPQEKGEYGFHLPSRFVFLVLGVDRSVLAVHRVHRDIADPRREIIAFSGVEGALKCYTISRNLFAETVGRGDSIGQLKKTYNVKQSSKKATSASLTSTVGSIHAGVASFSIQGQENLTTPHAVLVPPRFVDKVLRSPIDPKSLLKLAETVVTRKEQEKHGCFVNWVRRALTDGSGGLLPCATARLEGDYVRNLRTRLLNSDLPYYHPATKGIDIVPLVLTMGDDWSVVYAMNSEEHIVFRWKDKFILDEGFLPDLQLEVDDLLLDDDSSGTESTIVHKVEAMVGEWKGGSVDWARYAFVLADHRPELTEVITGIPSEMFMQQVVFSHIVCLFFSFKPGLYCADTDIVSGDVLMQEGEKRPMKIRPDGGIKVTERTTALLCMMELKNETMINRDDMAKSVLLTAMSALAIRKAGFRDTIHTPFVLGSGEVAYLFVTVLDKDSHIPNVKFVFSAHLGNPFSRTKFCTYLLVLLDRVATAAKTQAWGDMQDRLRLKDSATGTAFDHTIRPARTPSATDAASKLNSGG
jgi:hypothetical protein